MFNFVLYVLSYKKPNFFLSKMASFMFNFVLYVLSYKKTNFFLSKMASFMLIFVLFPLCLKETTIFLAKTASFVIIFVLYLLLVVPVFDLSRLPSGNEGIDRSSNLSTIILKSEKHSNIQFLKMSDTRHLLWSFYVFSMDHRVFQFPPDGSA